MKETALISLLWQRNFNVLQHYLKKDKPVSVFTLACYCSDELQAIVRAAGSRLFSIEEMLSDADRAGLEELSRHKSDRVMELINRAEALAGENAIGIDTLGAAVAANMPGYLEFAMPFVDGLERIQRNFFVELVVVNEDWTGSGKLLAEWARTHEVPCLHLAHGTGLSKHYTVHSTHIAQHVAVFGERGAQSFLDNGVTRERIHVTGNPAWDGYPALLRERSIIRSQLAAKYRLDPERPIIVFATTWQANLSAFDILAIEPLARSFFRAYRFLKAQGVAPQLLVKDRIALDGSPFLNGMMSRLAEEEQISPDDFAYTVQDAEWLVTASDVLVSIDSNIAIEAVLAGTFSINLMNPSGLLIGPSFAGDDGVVEVEPEQLADALMRILTDVAYRDALRVTMQRKAAHFNVGTDGQSAQRVAEAMRKLARVAAKRYAWQECLDITEKQDAIHEFRGEARDYYGGERNDLVNMLTHEPRFVLDIGCAAGMTGAAFKRQYPGVKVWGIELNPVAAERAAQHLDRVLLGKFEDFDLEKEGIAPGSLDVVIVADVLEHIYNPWDVLVRLKPLLSPDAQVVASIPNARNLTLMDNLAKGYWRYEEMGLLDITHIRFFTLKEIRRFFHETGYHIENQIFNLDPQLGDVFKRYQNNCPTDVDTGKIVLKNVTYDELMELCSIQIYVLAAPGAVEKDVADYESLQTTVEAPDVYAGLVEHHHLSKAQADLYEQRMKAWEVHPKFHLAIFATERTVARIQETMQSLAGQLYYNLRVSVIANCPAPHGIADSERFEWLYFAGDLLSAVNGVLSASDADWVGTIDAGDQLAPHTFLFLAEAAANHPDWQLIYSDEDRVGENGHFHAPCFKPDFNLDLLRSQPYLGGLAVVRQPLFAELSGFDPAFLGVEEYDLALRVLEWGGSKAFGHIADALYHRNQAGGHCWRPVHELAELGRTALLGHFQRSGVDAEVSPGYFPGSHRVSYRHAGHPLVSILIAVRDNLHKVQRCVESILASTDYPNYEILLVDNASQDTAAKDWFDSLDALGEDRLQIYRYPAPSNQALLHNLLAQEARGEYLLFLGFDSAILKGDWLDELMCHARRSEVGMVSPRLLGSDGMVRQTGQILGSNGAQVSAFHQVALDYAGYFGRAHLVQDFSALPAGCLLIRREIFFELDGFVGDRYPLDGAVLDFCLRLRDSGRLLVFTPFASILNEGGGEQVFLAQSPEEACKEDVDAIYRQWLPQLARDPAYNLNLATRGVPFEVGQVKLLTWDPLPWRPLPKILAYYADNQGCGQYRIIGPARHLDLYGKAQALDVAEILLPAEIERFDPDSIILQRQIMGFQIDALEKHKRYSRALRVFEIDDLITHVPEKSLHRAEIPKDIGDILRRAVALCDRFVVSTEPLAEAYKGMVDDIRVVPNFIRRDLWGDLNPLRRQSRLPRVGWAGGISHSGDLELIFDAIKETANEVDWVFFGMCPEYMRPYVREFHSGVPFYEYPAKLASLNLDLAVAPLELNPFNDSKSNLRLLEYGALGFPVICTDYTPYRGDFPVTRVENDTKAWVAAIREHVTDLDATAKMGDALRQKVMQEWVLEDNLDVWLKAWLP